MKLCCICGYRISSQSLANVQKEGIQYRPDWRSNASAAPYWVREHMGIQTHSDCATRPRHARNETTGEENKDFSSHPRFTRGIISEGLGRGVCSIEREVAKASMKNAMQVVGEGICPHKGGNGLRNRTRNMAFGRLHMGRTRPVLDPAVTHTGALSCEHNFIWQSN